MGLNTVSRRGDISIDICMYYVLTYPTIYVLILVMVTLLLGSLLKMVQWSRVLLDKQIIYTLRNSNIYVAQIPVTGP
jgi:hypothetical protein